MAKTPKKRAPKGYTVTLKIGDKTYTAKGATVTEAFEALERPAKIVTKGFLSIEGNNTRFDRMFMPMALRSFLRPAFAKILARSLERAMKPL